MRGLASGLAQIHRASNEDGCQRLFGRHGDLHPENILEMEHVNQAPLREDKSFVLQVADFGRTKFFDSPSSGDFSSGTGMYEGPECQLGLLVTSAYDIWSLGAIFLEFIIWLRHGLAALLVFSSDRLKADPLLGARWNDDYFFSLIYEEDSAVDAKVRSSVRSWIDRLGEDCSDRCVLRDVLRIVERDLLVVDPGKRIKAHELLAKLNGIVAGAETSASTEASKKSERLSS